MVFTDDIQKGPQRMPSKDHPIPRASLYLSQRVSSLLVDSCLLVEKKNPCQIQTSSSGLQLLGWEAFPFDHTSPLPIIASPIISQGAKKKKKDTYMATSPSSNDSSLRCNGSPGIPLAFLSPAR